MSRWRRSGRDCDRLFSADNLGFNLVHISLETEEQKQKKKRYVCFPNFWCFFYIQFFFINEAFFYLTSLFFIVAAQIVQKTNPEPRPVVSSKNKMSLHYWKFYFVLFLNSLNVM